MVVGYKHNLYAQTFTDNNSIAPEIQKKAQKQFIICQIYPNTIFIRLDPK